MKHNKIVKVLSLAAFVAMVVIAPLQSATGCQKQGEPEKKMGKGCQMEQGCMMLKHIPNLSDEQKAKLEKLHAEHQKLMAAAMADKEKLAGEMKGLMKEPFDVQKIEAKIDEMAKFHADMQKKCLAHRLAVKALLTDEQKAKLGDIGCGMGCGMAGAMMHGQGGCKMGQPKEGKGCMMEHGKEMKKGECPKKAEEEKK